MASEAFRYQVTRDLAARASAWDLFEGMQFLVNVCGEGGGRRGEMERRGGKEGKYRKEERRRGGGGGGGTREATSNAHQVQTSSGNLLM